MVSLQTLIRLGSDCGSNYVNQYTANSLALNKLQHNEDRDKKRHLSHKFSVAASIEFKWNGTMYGTEKDTIDCIRTALQNIESQVSIELLYDSVVISVSDEYLSDEYIVLFI